MATKKKMLQAAAGQAGGAALDITDVFSTYLLDNSGTVVNGIDLAGEGGLLWTKHRSGGALSFYQNHFLYDTERGYGSTDYLHSNNTDAAGATGAIASGSFNSDGFTTGGNIFGGNEWASWTFRKAPKFFTCVTYTGDSNATQTVNHDLGSVPGMIIIKKTDGTSHWTVYHRSAGSYRLRLNTTEAQDENGFWATSPTDTAFTLSNSDVKSDGATYVAYLFAHNDGDGGFGPDGDADVIKCGSYTGNGSTDGPEINLGFEPQWVMIKNVDAQADWALLDSMRGIATGGTDPLLMPNQTNAELTTNDYAELTATGLKIKTLNSRFNTSGNNYIYMAIRRGPLAQPESATEVFDMGFRQSSSSSGQPIFNAAFPVDLLMTYYRSGSASLNTTVLPRLTLPNGMVSALTGAESNKNYADGFDWNAGINNDGLSYGATTDVLSYMFRRAPGFFDAVAYTGTGSIRTVSHNLTVPPEMMLLKKRDSASNSNWSVYHKDLNGGTDSAEYYLRLETTNVETRNINYWDSTSPTDSVFTLGNQIRVNGAGNTFIAYLFATVPGVSKVGSITGTGSEQTIDCGFTSGARFVLIKRVSSTSDWLVFDTTSGIAVGNDPVLRLNSTDSEGSSDIINPHSSGFTINSTFGASGVEFIFYAIA